MQLAIIQNEEESQLLWALRVLRVSMKRLAKHTLITKAEWDLHDQAWDAAQRGDVHAFETAINDLDSRIHFHGLHLMDQEGVAQYRLVRSLIHCVQDVWPAFFQAH